LLGRAPPRSLGCARWLRLQGGMSAEPLGIDPVAAIAAIAKRRAVSARRQRQRRTTVRDLRKKAPLRKALNGRIAFRRWHHVEELRAWRVSVLRALAACVAPGQGPSSSASSSGDAGVDISVDGIRAQTSPEVVDELVEERLRAEGYASEPDERPPRRKRSAPKRRRSATNGSDIAPLEPREAGDASGDADDTPSPSRSSSSSSSSGSSSSSPSRSLGPVAAEQSGSERQATEPGAEDLARPPLKPIDEVEAACEAAMQTATADLLRMWGTTPFLRQHEKGYWFRRYSDASIPNPHAWWTRRLAPGSARADARLRRRMASSAEVIVTVAVSDLLGHKDQEFDVLASQPLHELRDALYFASDWMFDGPTRIKSGCFFIDGVFYSDRRDPTSIEYSREIIDWLKSTREPGFLRCETPRSMEVCLADLERIPFGERCVYIHQGDLEHSVYFTNARIMNVRSDCPYKEAYPILTFMRRFSKRKCYACLKNFAMWVVVDSSRCPHNPCYWCQDCFRHFYQDADGNYVQPVDYKVFPYLNDET